MAVRGEWGARGAWGFSSLAAAGLITTPPIADWNRLARQIYGDERAAILLRNANPGITNTEALTKADVLAPNAPKSSPFIAGRSVAPNDVEVAIDGTIFKHWQNIRVTRSIDTITTLSLTAPFDPEDAVKRRLFKPFSYNAAEVLVGGSTFFAGTMIAVDPQLDEQSNIVAASFYGKPGVMADCTAPASVYAERDGSIEWDNATLEVIAEDVAGFFGIKIQFLDNSGPPFERAGLQPNKKALPFLIELAAQRGLVISDTTRGAIVFRKAKTSGAAVASIEQGPAVEVTPMFNPQEYYSHVTGIAPIIIGLAGTQYTVKNERLAQVFRPYTFEDEGIIDSEIKAAVDSKVGRMFANAVSYSVKVATWRTPGGKIWEPNTIIKVKAPRAMIYTPFEFLIRSVQFDKSPEAETATLDLVLVGSLAGQIPGRMPWDD